MAVDQLLYQQDLHHAEMAAALTKAWQHHLMHDSLLYPLSVYVQMRVGLASLLHLAHLLHQSCPDLLSQTWAMLEHSWRVLTCVVALVRWGFCC